jgi:hypothetical protein
MAFPQVRVTKNNDNSYQPGKQHPILQLMSLETKATAGMRTKLI